MVVLKKIGLYFVFFDCINCDKCILVCFNNVNFSYEVVDEDFFYCDLVVSFDGIVMDGIEKCFWV